MYKYLKIVKHNLAPMINVPKFQRNRRLRNNSFYCSFILCGGFPSVFKARESIVHK